MTTSTEFLKTRMCYEERKNNCVRMEMSVIPKKLQSCFIVSLYQFDLKYFDASTLWHAFSSQVVNTLLTKVLHIVWRY